MQKPDDIDAGADFIPSMPGTPPAKIIVRDLVKRYGTTEAVRGVSFEVPAGTVFGLLGPNGAGKTSVLECLLGLRRPDGGSIHIDGIDALAQPERAKGRIGAALQSTELQDRITPREALELFGAFYPSTLPTDALLARCALAEKADAPFDSLSAGQRQRLALALAFVHQPDILCLDEPTAGLDARSQRGLHEVIRALRAEGRTVLLTTHHTEEAHALCDEVALLDAGRIAASGPPQQLIARNRAFPRLTLRTAEPLDVAALLDLPEILSAEFADGETRLAVEFVAPAVVAVVRLLEATENELLDLRVAQPSLEDTLIQLTGNRGAALR